MDNHLNLKPEKKGILWEAKTRILVWYIAVISFFLVMAMPVISHLTLYQVSLRVRKHLELEVEVFKEFKNQEQYEIDNPQTAKLTKLFDDFLKYQIPEDDTFLIGIIDRQFYQSHPHPRPDIFADNSALMKKWLETTELLEEELVSDDPEIGTVIHIAQPIVIDGEVRGVFVAAHFTAGEVAEAIDAVKVSILILFIFLLLGAFAAWVASGKVLNPLRNLSRTVAKIDESDLTQRIEITGTGEIAQLTYAFNQMMIRLNTVFMSQRETIK